MSRGGSDGRRRRAEMDRDVMRGRRGGEGTERDAGTGVPQPSAVAFNDSWTYSSDISGPPPVSHVHAQTHILFKDCALPCLC